MTRATPEQQRELLELQATDTAIRQLEHRRAHLPEQQALDEHEETLTRVTRELTDAREELSRVELRQKRLEGEVAAVDSRRKSEEGRMYSGRITSDKELQALRAELSALKGRKGDLEDELLDLMERREELEATVTSLSARHAELTAQVSERASARDAAATDIDAELSDRHQQRAARAAAVDSDQLAVYDTLRQRKGGLGIAELQGRTCAGCRLELTAIELEGVREDAQTSLAFCEHCDRILVPSS